MKRLFITLVLLSGLLMVSCGNSELDNKIEQLVKEATEKTKKAASSKEVGKIAKELENKIEEIKREAGENLPSSKDIKKTLDKYQDAATDKLGEFGIELE